jgi:hypothetical protein
MVNIVAQTDLTSFPGITNAPNEGFLMVIKCYEKYQLNWKSNLYRIVQVKFSFHVKAIHARNCHLNEA